MMRPKKNKNRRKLKRAPKATPNYGLNSKPFTDFSEFVNKRLKQYVEKFSENDKSFLPFPVLSEYWTKGKVIDVLNAFDPPLSIGVDTIKDGYIRILSMLVYCNETASLAHFTKHNLNDNKLPLKKRPEEWKGIIYDNLYNSVSKFQWIFFPLIFAPTYLDDCDLDRDQVLPIIKLEKITPEWITQVDGATIQKMTIHDSCHCLVKNRQNRPNQSTFVLKTYNDPRFQPIYENEVDALRTLKNSRSSNVIMYYGSFRQNGTCNIILEYANGGDLAGFLKNTPNPKGDDVLQFWQSMSLCFNGLHSIHHLINTNGNKLNGIHEDIKPGNILLFKGSSGSPYDFVPKIADFGLFTRVKGAKTKTSSLDAMGRDKIGDQIYSSPESSHHAPYHENAPNTINTRADIFSFGTVLSEASAWVKGGHSEMLKYNALRRAFHQTKPAFCGNDYEGCFHDGVEMLPVVKEIHTAIREHCRSINDHITPRIVDIIEKHMLLSNPNNRPNARQLQERFQQVFNAPNESIGSSFDIPLPEPPPKKPGLSLEQLGEFMTRRSSTTSRNGSDYQNSMKTEIEKLVNDLEVNVPDRHHLFFIDDSTSMKEHAESIQEAFSALLFLTRELEGHKVELSFVSGPSRPCSRRRSKKLRQLVERRKYQRDPDMMENRFRRLIDDVIIPRLPMHIFGININIFAKKPTSIYVLTDGNWRGDDAQACGVEKPIRRLREELERRGLDRNHISFHFVRLGDSANGKRYLNYLDRFGRVDEQDNVDVKTMSSSVKSILIGPLTQSNDDSDEDEYDD